MPICFFSTFYKRSCGSIAQAAFFAVVLFTAAPSAAQDIASLPSLNLAGLFEAEMHLTLHTDWRRYSVVTSEQEPSIFDLRRARIKVEGTLLSRIDYEIARDVRDDASPWGDVYANLRISPALQVRAGRIKVPNGLEYLNSVTELDFVSRALTSEYLTAGRELGAMAHGNLFGKRVKYQAGIFRAGGDNTRRSERELIAPSPTVAGRVVVKPWDAPRSRSPLAPLAFGVSFTSGGIPEGPNSLRGHDHADVALFHEVYVNGRRRRIAAEAAWRLGRAGISAERMFVVDERRGAGIDDDDLTPALADGWYVSGTWLLTGEKPTDRRAIEAAARIEGVRFGSAAGGVPASAQPRARTIAEDRGRAITFGVNWHPISGIRLQFNVIRESTEMLGVPVTGRTPTWGRVLRLEVAL